MPEYKCPECGHVTYRTVPAPRLTCVKCGEKWNIDTGPSIEIMYPERDSEVPRGYIIRGRTFTPEEFTRKVREAQIAGINFFEYIEKFNPNGKNVGDPLIRLLAGRRRV